MSTEWHEFDARLGDKQLLPELRKLVMVAFAPRDGYPCAMAAGYLKFAAGCHESPQFITPGVAIDQRNRRITHWCDCLPENLNAPKAQAEKPVASKIDSAILDYEYEGFKVGPYCGKFAVSCGMEYLSPDGYVCRAVDAMDYRYAYRTFLAGFEALLRFEARVRPAGVFRMVPWRGALTGSGVTRWQISDRGGSFHRWLDREGTRVWIGTDLEYMMLELLKLRAQRSGEAGDAS